SFAIDATTGVVTINGSANFEAKGSYSIDVIATDGGTGHLTGTKTVTINGTDVNEAPTVTSGATGSVTENNTAGATVYTATATDPDTTAPNKTITWSLGGTDAAAFTINAATGVVKIVGAADYETQSSYSIDVIATDGGGLSDTRAVAIT